MVLTMKGKKLLEEHKENLVGQDVLKTKKEILILLIVRMATLA